MYVGMAEWVGKLGKGLGFVWIYHGSGVSEKETEYTGLLINQYHISESVISQNSSNRE